MRPHLNFAGGSPFGGSVTTSALVRARRFSCLLKPVDGIDMGATSFKGDPLYVCAFKNVTAQRAQALGPDPFYSPLGGAQAPAEAPYKVFMLQLAPQIRLDRLALLHSRLRLLMALVV